MKIRIKGNDLRYRLTRSDISKFEADGFLEERTEFAGQPFIYALRRSDNDHLTATFTDGTICLFMPENMLAEWVNTGRVGFENSDGKLNLIIEKDFVCLDDPAKDQSDYFPNPLAENYEKGC